MMQDKLKKILKEASILSVHPDSDWAKILIGSAVLFCCLLAWSGYLYIHIQTKVAASQEAATGKGSTAQGASEGNNELKATIDKYDAKKSHFNELHAGKPTPLADPASS